MSENTVGDIENEIGFWVSMRDQADDDLKVAEENLIRLFQELDRAEDNE